MECRNNIYRNQSITYRRVVRESAYRLGSLEKMDVYSGPPQGTIHEENPIYL